MKIIETIDWILDKDEKQSKGEKEYRSNIEFVHSLGLKCDSVGWSTLDLQDPRADEILSAIEAFCKKNGWKARGNYTRKYTDYMSDWYELVPTEFKDNTLLGFDDKCESERGEKIKIYNLKACNEPHPSPKWWYESILVPERFRDACIRHGINDVDFCWAKDKGKYQAEQYFHLYSNKQVTTIAEGRGLSIEDREKINALGGSLPKIADIFYKLQQIHLQDCYIEADIPNGSIALAYCPKTFSYYGKNIFLIRKSLAETLLEEKAISEKDLIPAMVVKELPNGYTLSHTVMPGRPTVSYLQKSISEYEKLKNTERPLRLISENDALKLLKLAKKERKEDFSKALPKDKSVGIAETRYAPVLPYYSVANGGYLSDEYELLPYDIATECNKSFEKELLAEEALEVKPDGVVIARCPDGDNILLCRDGKVIRFGQEEPAVIEEWVSLAQFIAGAING